MNDSHPALPEWVRQEIYNLQERVEKLETGSIDPREPAYKAELYEERRQREHLERQVNMLRLENDELRKKAERISAKLLEGTRQQTARECAEIVDTFMVSEPSDWLSSPNLYLGRVRVAILRKFGIDGK
jgi:molecular chaperone GrpE (heat shock protein)